MIMTYCCCSKCHGRQLRPISPFSNKCEDKSLDENSIDKDGLKSIVNFLSKLKKLKRSSVRFDEFQFSKVKHAILTLKLRFKFFLPGNFQFFSHTKQISPPPLILRWFLLLLQSSPMPLIQEVMTLH